MKKQYGFTIIELMIAIAIVGVLAAIAVPAYQDYVKRARVSEGINLALSVQQAVAVTYGTTNSLPTSNTQAGLALASSINGISTKSISVGSGGIITITYYSVGDSQTGGIGVTGNLTITESPVLSSTAAITSWTITSSGTYGVPQKWCPATASCSGTGS